VVKPVVLKEVDWQQTFVRFFKDNWNSIYGRFKDIGSKRGRLVNQLASKIGFQRSENKSINP